MEETPITFQVAKLAKEKGFDLINVHDYYHINKGYNLGYALCISEAKKQTDGCLLAPTQSLLQKWLREKHGIHIFVIPCVPYSFSPNKDLDVIWIFTICKPLLVEYGCPVKNEFRSYEEALEEGLEQALKLI